MMTTPEFRQPSHVTVRRQPAVPAPDPALGVVCAGLAGCGAEQGDLCREMPWERHPGAPRPRVHMIRVALYRKAQAELEVAETEREELARRGNRDPQP